MKKEETLAKARRDYPIGTVYESPYSKAIVTVYKTKFHYRSSDNSTHVGGSFVQYNSKWAKIISKPSAENIGIDYEIY